MPGFFINVIELDNKTVACTRAKEYKTARKQFSEWVSLITTRTSSANNAFLLVDETRDPEIV